jgi:NhaC family Na+:H+ antiporter
MSGVLGVSTASYFPYCFFNLLSPILDVLFGFIGFKVPSSERPRSEPSSTVPSLDVAPSPSSLSSQGRS